MEAVRPYEKKILSAYAGPDSPNQRRPGTLRIIIKHCGSSLTRWSFHHFDVADAMNEFEAFLEHWGIKDRMVDTGWVTDQQEPSLKRRKVVQTPGKDEEPFAIHGSILTRYH